MQNSNPNDTMPPCASNIFSTVGLMTPFSTAIKNRSDRVTPSRKLVLFALLTSLHQHPWEKGLLFTGVPTIFNVYLNQYQQRINHPHRLKTRTSSNFIYKDCTTPRFNIGHPTSFKVHIFTDLAVSQVHSVTILQNGSFTNRRHRLPRL